MNEYNEQAEKFLNDTKTKLTVTLLGTFPYFDDDEEKRDVYSVSLVNDKYAYVFKFGDSIHSTEMRLGTLKNSNGKTRNPAIAKMKADHKKPNAYDILSCLEKYDTESHEYFCDNFGYDIDSRKGLEVYLACQKECDNLCKLFTSKEMEQLREIQ